MIRNIEEKYGFKWLSPDPFPEKFKQDFNKFFNDEKNFAKIIEFAKKYMQELYNELGMEYTQQ